MLKYFVIALLIAFCNANPLIQLQPKGSVDFTSCGGDGRVEELRVDECEGSPCDFYGGHSYGLQVDFVPHLSSRGVSFRLIVVLTGIDVPVLDVPITGQEISAGQAYTLSYVLTADDLLAGQSIVLKLEIYHTQETTLEACISAPAIIHEAP